jgi:TPR repeat protein
MHIYCGYDLKSMKMAGSCPMCRAKAPTSPEEVVKQLRPWVKKKKAWAQAHLASKYEQGKGVKQSYEMARILNEHAAQQGDVSAMSSLACLYANGDGVERDLTKARELWTNSAEQGHEDSIKCLKKLDDMEREAAALDPNAIVCSACGLPQTSTRGFNKFKCPCKSTRYCNTKCQKKHWNEHRTECKRLIAELKRARKLEVAEEQNNRNVLGVNAGTLPVKDEVNQDDDEGKEKSGTKEPKEKTNEK